MFLFMLYYQSELYILYSLSSPAESTLSHKVKQEPFKVADTL